MKDGLTFPVIVASAIVLSACTTTRGPQPVVSASGIVNNAATTGIAGSFVRSESASAVNMPDPNLAKKYMTDGFSLIYANCSDFFQSAGATQKWLIFSRDTVGAIGTLATGIMALHDYGSTAIANVAFGTGAAFIGLDIYTKNFLFAAENVESVRELVGKALYAHRQEVETLTERKNLDYAAATLFLQDNQDICSPMKIASMAREAIRNGRPVPTVEIPATTGLPPAVGGAMIAPVPRPAAAAGNPPASGTGSSMPFTRVGVRIQ